MIGFALRFLVPLLAVAGLCAWSWTGGRASERKEWQLKEAAQVAAQLAATEQARAVEQQLQERVNDANKALQTERSKHARIAATLRSELDGLRGDIATFASPRPDDSSTALSERCAVTGELLSEALRTSEACAVEGEQVASYLRAVLAAWPR